jgi:uncharacterized protein YjdB
MTRTGFLYSGAIAMAALLMVSCSGNNPNAPDKTGPGPSSGGITTGGSIPLTIAVTGISVTPASLSLTQGNKGTLTATVTPATATNKKVTWSSSNIVVATVDDTGTVTAGTPGTATITATTEDGGKTATSTVIVSIDANPNAGVLATGLSVTPTTLNLTQGDTSTLTATVTPANATNKTVSWSSSNNAVATVDNTGKVTAVGVGVATITAGAASCQICIGLTATSTVTVTPAISTNPPPASVIHVTGVTMSPSGSTHGVLGQTIHLTAAVLPSNALNKKVTWSLSRGGSTVTPTGPLTADLTFGTQDPFTVTVTTEDGGFTASLVIIAVDAPTVSVTGVSILNSYDGSTMSGTNIPPLAVGYKIALAAKVLPANATNTAVIWSSSNNNVATVSSSGFFTTVGAGSATITVTTVDGGYKASFSVYVPPTELVPLPPR